VGRVGRADGHGPASPHRVGRVHEEVHQDLFDLAGVGLDGGKVPVELQLNADFLPRPVEGLAGVLHGLVEVDGPDLVAALAGVAQQLGREAGAAVDELLDVAQPLVVLVLRAEIEEHQRGVSLDGHEQVVEVVGDPAGQGADGLHLLGLAQLGLEEFFLLLGALALRDVPGDPVDAADLSAAVLGELLHGRGP